MVGEGVAIDPEIMSGQPCIAGTRIPVSLIGEFASAGYDVPHILSEYPGLNAEQIAEALCHVCYQATLSASRQAVSAPRAPAPSAGSVWHGTLLSVDFEEDELTFKISDMGKPIAAGRYAIVPEADFFRFVFGAALNAKKLARLTAKAMSTGPKSPNPEPNHD